MSKHLEKAKELAKKTNAAVVVVNETTDDAFVILGLEEYEKLLDLRQTTYDKRPTTNDLRQTTFPTADKSSVVSRELSVKNDTSSSVVSHESLVKNDESSVVSRQSSVSLAALTEDELLAKINQEIGEWREGQVDKQNILLAEMPAQLSLKNDKGNERGGYNLVGAKVDFRVDNLEEEERYFLEPLD